MYVIFNFLILKLKKLFWSKMVSRKKKFNSLIQIILKIFFDNHVGESYFKKNI